jgi:hypothetical protein
MTKTYFYCALGYKNGITRQISGIVDFDTDPRRAFKEVREWLSADNEFDGVFAIAAFNSV